MLVVSLSLGAAFSQTVNNAVDALTQLGIPCVVAAGNSNIDASQASPASSVGAITVGASGKTDLKESKSSVLLLCVSLCVYLPLCANTTELSFSLALEEWLEERNSYFTSSVCVCGFPYVCNGC
jgi:hypothetical protein